ncbi:Multidrug/Oligosaccharidyl-lipid/Polysaccharide (MOP) Flippase transporter [Phytophthora megakarya]|uniref:Multidrug/Oligosaccharidyl-lipid/Polysaccharide (MOP) Flippase transporter n=1 Tax=Phytophthora megakarya TaxID=4795 RepID=A0A225WHC8_9STRA|nr:Multidrug/Oligosaccharidyl-lipid/Polysaccharide (MOP) Flippase transporter [Phytophthora megakarya]
MRGSLRSSALGPPSQIPTGPASRAPRSGLLWYARSYPLTLVGLGRLRAISVFLYVRTR